MGLLPLSKPSATAKRSFYSDKATIPIFSSWGKKFFWITPQHFIFYGYLTEFLFIIPMKWCSNTSYLFISYHYTYEVIMKCYEVLRCLFMHIINCICETYDGNMKCWGVHSYFHFCTYAQKKSSLFTRAFYLTDYL